MKLFEINHTSDGTVPGEIWYSQTLRVLFYDIIYITIVKFISLKKLIIQILNINKISLKRTLTTKK